MTNKQKAIGRYFKAIGFVEPDNFCGQWIQSDGEGEAFDDLPDIIDHYPSFKKWVLERMDADGCHWNCTHQWEWIAVDEDFINENGERERYPYLASHARVEDNEITLAAVEAATRYFSQKDTSC